MSNNNQPYISGGYEVSTWYMHQIYVEGRAVIMGVSNYVVPSIGDLIIEVMGDIVKHYRVDTKNGLSVTYSRVYMEGHGSDIVNLTSDALSHVSIVLMRTNSYPVLAAVHIGLPIESDIPVAYAKVYTGTDIGNLDAVVSRNYDNDGIVIDTKIRATKSDLNEFTYHLEQFYLDRVLADKASGTIVFYGSDDTPIGRYSISFRESNSLVNYSGTELFITDIVLESGHVNPVNSKEILVKRGFINSSFNPRIYKVFNKDGARQREEISLTSRNVTLEGWGAYIVGEENDTFPLSVQYKLASNEVSDLISDENGEIITSHYTVRVVDDEGYINYKIYPVLLWNIITSEYELRTILYSSTYKTNIDVTELISISGSLEPFNFVDKQLFNFSMNLKDVMITPEDSTISGSFAITLCSPPMGSTTPFRIFMVPSDEVRYYGEAIRSRVTHDLGEYVLSIDSDYTSFDEWLDNAYHKLLPVYDSNVLDKAPTPTHVEVNINGTSSTIELLTQWNIGVKTTKYPEAGSVAILQWYSIDEDGDRNNLAISSMQVENV